MKNLAATTIAKGLNDQVFCRYGLPSGIKFDNAMYFSAQLMGDLLNLLGISRTFSPPYNPKSNTVERAHKDLKARMKRCAEQDPNWINLIPYYSYVANVLVNQTTSFSPFFMLFGKQLHIYSTLVAVVHHRSAHGHKLITKLKRPCLIP